MLNFFQFVKKIFDRIPPILKYIILLFVITRLLLSIIGWSSQIILYDIHGQTRNVWTYSEHKVLNSWGVWDSGWYLGIAQDWYSDQKGAETTNIAGQATYAFFPLYPALIRIFYYITGDYFISSLIISNVALLISCWFLYKLVKLDFGEKTAKKSIKYLLIYPVSFILSGAFSEATYLALIISAFYFAKTNRWWLVGILGFLLSLTRSLGVLVFLPLLYIYLKNINYKITIKKLKSAIWLLLIPLGIIIWMWYNYYLTGDYLAFIHIQNAWNRQWNNPIIYLFESLLTKSIYDFICGATAISVLFLSTLYAKKIGWAYYTVCLYTIIIPLSTGWQSMPRLSLATFPIFIVLALMSKNNLINQILTIGLAMILGFFMVFWANGFGLII